MTALPPMLPGAAFRALDDILQERLAQMASHGHHLDADDDRPVDHLPKLVHDYALIASEYAHAGVRQDLARARRKLVQVAALSLAAIERVDRAAAAAALIAEPQLEI